MVPVPVPLPVPVQGAGPPGVGAKMVATPVAGRTTVVVTTVLAIK